MDAVLSRLFSSALRPPVDTAGFTLILAAVVAVSGFRRMQLSSRVRNWLGRIFDPPLSERHFDRAMAEQTEEIREVGIKVEKGNERVVAAVAAVEAGNDRVVAAVQEFNAEILALVSEMKQALSEASDDIRAHSEARSSDAVGSAPPEDDPD